MIRFSCSHCDEEMEISDRMAGRKIDCVECGARVRVPDAEEEDAPRQRREMEAERPSKRRSEIVEGAPPRQRREKDEEASPTRRSEIAEGEPPSRGDSEYVDEPPPPRKKKKKRGGLRRSDLRQVAIYQKVILICILVYLILVVVNIVLQSIGMPPFALLPLALVAFGAVITGAVFVFMMALKLNSVGIGVVLGIITLIPIIGLIVLLVINSKATAALRYGGYKVGLLGVPLWQFDE